MAQAIDFDSPVVVIEFCVGCGQHSWNTRHDENKYKGYAMEVADGLRERMPDVQIFANEIPTHFMFSDNYFQLIPENPAREDTYEMLPRIGAFEVSTVLDHQSKRGDVLFFSKLMSSCWPHVPSLVKRIEKCIQHNKEGGDANGLKDEFNTTGMVVR